jgi:hypothetical protein
MLYTTVEEREAASLVIQKCSRARVPRLVYNRLNKRWRCQREPSSSMALPRVCMQRKLWFDSRVHFYRMYCELERTLNK